jgi:hypothetical protein
MNTIANRLSRGIVSPITNLCRCRAFLVFHRARFPPYKLRARYASAARRGSTPRARPHVRGAASAAQYAAAQCEAQRPNGRHVDLHDGCVNRVPLSGTRRTPAHDQNSRTCPVRGLAGSSFVCRACSMHNVHGRPHGWGPKACPCFTTVSLARTALWRDAKSTRLVLERAALPLAAVDDLARRLYEVRGVVAAGERRRRAQSALLFRGGGDGSSGGPPTPSRAPRRLGRQRVEHV